MANIGAEGYRAKAYVAAQIPKSISKTVEKPWAFQSPCDQVYEAACCAKGEERMRKGLA